MLTDTLLADLAVLHVFRAMQSLIVSLTTSSFVVAASLHWPGKVSDLKQVRLPPPSVKMECVCVWWEGRVQERNKRGTAVTMCFSVLPKISVKCH